MEFPLRVSLYIKPLLSRGFTGYANSIQPVTPNVTTKKHAATNQPVTPTDSLRRMTWYVKSIIAQISPRRR
jgi:hypothetical protein